MLIDGVAYNRQYIDPIYIEEQLNPQFHAQRLEQQLNPQDQTQTLVPNTETSLLPKNMKKVKGKIKEGKKELRLIANPISHEDIAYNSRI